MTTIEDVAKQANTSIATVSRVINNKKGYSEETRVRVLKAIEQTGYESNAIAKSLKNQKTNTIGVIIPNVSSMLSSEILKGIEEFASGQGYNVLVSYTYSNPEKVMKTLKTFYEQRIDGIIFTSDPLHEDYYMYMRRMSIPIVLVATESEHYDIPFVKVNDYEAAYTAVSYLIEHGHTEIGMLSGLTEDLISGKPRIEGYKLALKENKIEPDPFKIKTGENFSFMDGYNNFKQLIEDYPNLTAIFAASDEMAAGAIQAAHKMGIEIPNDISIIGYDNVFLSKAIWPPLTTVAQPLQKMGYSATRILIHLMENPTKTYESDYIDFEIIERESTKER